MQELTIEILTSDDVEAILPVDTERLQEYAARVLREEGVPAGEFNVVFIGDEFMIELNEMYKGRKGTTDVLSFNLSDESSEGVSGEIYVSLEQARNQALELGVPFDEEVVRLVTHGLLHLAGQVHDTDEQYDAMMDRTERLVREFFSNRGTV
jgi:probable rRNA maturation factor